ncbi:MAG TPA: exodeoxyribonuclease VII large subunit [Candidatus Acidoferrum sp.]|nr:exodeoxyribonuclease VII large subunit [Candidatus Acidoferrum sp.]
MKTLFAATLVLSVSSLLAVAQTTNSPGQAASPPKRIAAADAAKHYDETVIVTGKVAQVSIRSRLVYLNLDKKYPECPMYCVVFARSTNQFGDLKQVEGKQVEIQGKIQQYQSKPQIVLSSSNQLKVVERAPEPAGVKTNQPASRSP